MVRLVLAVMVAATFAASCSGSSTQSPTTTPAPVAAVQQQALRAYAQLQSGVVHVAGQASQGTTSVEFTLDYTSAGDRFAYTAHSTLQGRQSQVDVIGVPPQAWSMEGGAWKPLPDALTVDTFRARRIWSLVPFDSANPVATETVAGVSAMHYRYSGKVGIELASLAGSLIASDTAEFAGQLRQVDIDYWVDQAEGWPVKVSYRLSGDGALDLTAELARPNDPTLSVQPPS